MRYCERIFETVRQKTREVKVGSIGIGGVNPIRIQSMTTSNTRDVEATIEQIVRLEQGGCEIARVTVQGMKEAEACEKIKSRLLQKGCLIPLVADIHFYPPAAMKAVEFVDKVRINPGNYADKRALFIQKEYTDVAYLEELDKIRETFSPLVLKCKTLKKALRIGTNHGSLSDRIMNRYGDTAQGMIESAFEFTRICREHDFHDIVFSMKASNPLVMIEAYRLLSAQMRTLGWDYPIHLGVTEAGEGEDGRVKSALGIGSLLLDGIGDTIRVSLTEDPWAEIDPCKKLVFLAQEQAKKKGVFFEENHRKIIDNGRSFSVREPFFHPGGGVVLPCSPKEFLDPDLFLTLKLHEGKKGLYTPDFLWIEGIENSKQAQEVLHTLVEKKIGVLSQTFSHPLVTSIISSDEACRQTDISSKVVLVRSGEEEKMHEMKALLQSSRFILFCPTGSCFHEGRRFYEKIRSLQIETEVIFVFSQLLAIQEAVIEASAVCGSLLVDGLFDGICLDIACSFAEKQELSFSLLQAARRKTVKTEFISCPGCGRTLFNLQEVSKRIRDKTAHLPGVRIAIMGCIVNGPGEMADADFGYVGSRPGKIDLYIGKKCVERNIDFEEGDTRLIELIKHQGKWVEPVNS